MTIDVIEVNCETGETIERSFTEEEKNRYELGRLAVIAEKEAQELEKTRIESLKASAKAKLIAGQPLTAEEADMLVI